MTKRMRYTGVATPVVLLAVLAACSTPPATSESKLGATAGDATSAAQANGAAAAGGLAIAPEALGLVRPVGTLNANQVQVQSKAGVPIANAKVTIGSQIFITDANGRITLPTELTQGVATEGKKLAASISAPGFVGTIQTIVPGWAVPVQQVDARRTEVTAVAGATVENADGSMRVTFPPGSLTGDGSVAVTKQVGRWGLPGQTLPETIPFGVSANPDAAKPLSLNDAGYKMADNRPLGTYSYHMDLPEGVQVAPGAQIKVSFKAEGDMARLLADRYLVGDKFEDTTDVVTRDADGNFWLTMAVAGPDASLAAPLAGAGTAKRKLLAAQCNSYTDTTTSGYYVPNVVNYTPGIEVPIWKNGYRTSNNVSVDALNAYAPSHGGVCVNWTTPYQYENNGYNMQDGSSIPGWITLMTHNPSYNEGRCVYYQFDPNQYYCQNGQIYKKDPGQHWVTTYQYWYTKTINALVNWASDDPRISGPVAGARVDFSHATVAARGPQAMSFATGSDGYASGLGTEGSAGYATASLPSQPYTTGSNGSYLVNCSTVGLTIGKYMPKVNVQANVSGAFNGAAPLLTSHGEFALSGTSLQIKPTIGIANASEVFRINGTKNPNATTWVDAQSGQINAGWNGNYNLPTSVWISRPITTNLSYASNDASVAADQRPVSRWSGQTATADTITFNHPQSAYGAKTRNEPLTFSGVSSASTWGISGATSQIAALRSANGVTLSGTATGTVNASTVALKLNANLPSVTLNVGDTSAATGVYTMDYELTDAAGNTQTKSMVLPAASGGSVTVAIPVEDVLNIPGKHTFKPKWIATADGAHAISLKDKTYNFPALAGIHRGGTFVYAAQFESAFVSPK